jgi:recombination protein RecR
VVSYPQSVLKLIRELSRLPSIGEKSAARLAYFLVNTDKKQALDLAAAINGAVTSIKFCENCYFFAEDKLCTVCSNSSRDMELLCVVEKPMDVIAIERMSEFNGLYHVLHGLWAPLKGRGPESMKINELLKRIDNGVKEVILATSSTVEGDATALYIAKLLAGKGIKSTRPAQGMPKGAELEYADDLTLSRAFSARNIINL